MEKSESPKVGKVVGEFLVVLGEEIKCDRDLVAKQENGSGDKLFRACNDDKKIYPFETAAPYCRKAILC
jgi:hypothetical protein